MAHLKERTTGTKEEDPLIAFLDNIYNGVQHSDLSPYQKLVAIKNAIKVLVTLGDISLKPYHEIIGIANAPYTSNVINRTINAYNEEGCANGKLYDLDERIKSALSSEWQYSNHHTFNDSESYPLTILDLASLAMDIFEDERNKILTTEINDSVSFADEYKLLCSERDHISALSLCQDRLESNRAKADHTYRATINEMAEHAASRVILYSENKDEIKEANAFLDELKKERKGETFNRLRRMVNLLLDVITAHPSKILQPRTILRNAFFCSSMPHPDNVAESVRSANARCFGQENIPNTVSGVMKALDNLRTQSPS